MTCSEMCITNNDSVACLSRSLYLKRLLINSVITKNQNIFVAC